MNLASILPDDLIKHGTDILRKIQMINRDSYRCGQSQTLANNMGFTRESVEIRWQTNESTKLDLSRNSYQVLL